MISAMKKKIAQAAIDVSKGVPEFRLARSQHELQQAFQLSYRSYSQAGLVADNPSGLRLTPYHFSPDSEVLIGSGNGIVFSTMSMFCDGKLGLPMQSTYPTEIESLREQGLKLAEVGCLADRRQSNRRYIETFIALGRLVAQAAAHRGIQALVVYVRPKHAKLYTRMLGFTQIGRSVKCPYANGTTGVALCLRFDQLSDTVHQQFFGSPIATELLNPYAWPQKTRNYFNRVLKNDDKIAEVVKVENYFNWGRKQAPKPAHDLLPIRQSFSMNPIPNN